MYTVKISGTGMLIFKGKQTRIPAIIKKVSEKDLNLLKVMIRANNFEYEVLEAESDRIAAVVQKAKNDDLSDLSDFKIEDTESKIEDLFESEDTMSELLKNLNKEE